MKLRIFISSVQKEFAEERRMLADYIRAQVGGGCGTKSRHQVKALSPDVYY